MSASNTLAGKYPIVTIPPFIRELFLLAYRVSPGPSATLLTIMVAAFDDITPRARPEIANRIDFNFISFASWIW
jgi:hypothetical protein